MFYHYYINNNNDHGHDNDSDDDNDNDNDNNNQWSHNLQWSQQINQISLRANRMLGFIRRIYRDISYCTMAPENFIVRPKLEYARELCSPCTCKDNFLLANVQCRASKFNMNYPKDMSYNDRLLKLNLSPLGYRRHLKDQVLILKAKVGHVDLSRQDFFRLTEIYTPSQAQCMQI